MAALVKCWRLAESDISHMYGLILWWYNYVADTPLQQHWLMLPKWVRNVNLHCLVQSKWKFSKRPSVPSVF